MRSDRILTLLWLSWSCVGGISISHWELEAGNRTCGGKESCSEDGDKIANWLDRNCQCDAGCATYGDCCPDSGHFQLHEQRRGAASFSCIELRQFGGIYMRTTCPPEWSESSTRSACESSSIDISDPLAAVPATDLRTGVTYRNIFCAICHRAEELDVWHPRLECPGVHSSLSLDSANISQLLYFNRDMNAWGFKLKSTFQPCSIDPSFPETSQHLVRRCLPNIIKTCAVNWTNVDVRTRCEAYTNVVFEGDSVYRNPHCAVCNNIPLHLLQCSFSIISFRSNFKKYFSPSAFAVLFDLSGGPPGKTLPCEDDQLYDPFYKRCRSVITEFFQRNVTTQIPFSKETNVTNVIPLISKCNKFLLEKSDFVTLNNTVYVSRYRKRFREGEFNIRGDGSLEVCSDKFGTKIVNKFDKYMGYVTFVGLGVSIIFLILHLMAFFLVPELRNLSGKNLTSLCVALLMAYICFMFGQVLSGPSCHIVAILTFYFFLASFFWMLIMSFDVWHTLRLATAELRVVAGKQWRKFIIYSLYSWIFPGAVVATALLAEHSTVVGVDWKPGFGVSSCWFGRTRPLLIFFAVPLAIVMSLNIAFFVSSSYMVYSTTSTTRFTASAGTQRDFRLFLRLAVMMGLTWATGLIAAFFDIQFLWYLFILFNTLQGFFIFLAFTCNQKVVKGLAVYRGSKSEVIPRSFSWSTDSMTRKSNIESEKTMDTLY